jgi:hypothetical protein
MALNGTTLMGHYALNCGRTLRLIPGAIDGVKEGCVPLYEFPWGPAPRKRGLAKGAIYLVRPDGIRPMHGAPEIQKKLERLLSKSSL